MLNGIDTLLVVKPTGLFFLKEELREFTTDAGMERIINLVNKKLAGQRHVRPKFSFEKVENLYQLHIWEPGFQKQADRFIDTIELMVMKNEKLNTEYLMLNPQTQVQDCHSETSLEEMC